MTFKDVFASRFNEQVNRVQAACHTLQEAGYNISTLSFQETLKALQENNLIPDDIQPERFTAMVTFIINNSGITQDIT